MAWNGKQHLNTLSIHWLKLGFDETGKTLADALFKFFGPGTEYEKARTQSKYPLNGPYTNHCIKILVANRENETEPAADPSSKDPDGLCKAVAVIALLSGKESLVKAVKACVNTAQVSMSGHGEGKNIFLKSPLLVFQGQNDYETMPHFLMF